MANNNTAAIENPTVVGTVTVGFWEKTKAFVRALEITHRMLTTVIGVAVIALLIIATATSIGLGKVGKATEVHSLQIAKLNAEVTSLQAYMAKPLWYRLTHKY